MSPLDAREIGRRYADYVASGDESVIELFSPDFFDNVGKQLGLASSRR